jgi:hypothetical protein
LSNSTNSRQSWRVLASLNLKSPAEAGFYMEISIGSSTPSGAAKSRKTIQFDIAGASWLQNRCASDALRWRRR